MRRVIIDSLRISVLVLATAAGVPNSSLTAAGLIGSQWKQIGPGPINDPGTGQITVPGGTVSGLVTDIAIDPSGTTDNIIYIATDAGGIWKSTDGGKTWKPKTDSMPTLLMGAVALDPSNPSIVYAGSGSQANCCGGDFFAAGVYKSSDGGDSWQILNPGGVFSGNPNNGGVGGISRIVLPNSSTLLVGTAGGLFRSTDGGASFSIPLNGVISDLRLDTASSNTVYAAVAGAGIFKSADGGATFGQTPIFSATSTGLPQGLSFGGIVFAQSTQPNGNTFYATAILTAGQPLLFCGGPFGNGPGLYRSTDGGQNWSEIKQGPELPASLQTSVVGNQTIGYDLILGVDPQDANTYYYGLRGLMAATDGGASGLRDKVASGPFPCPSASQDNRIDLPKAHSDYHAITFSPAGHITGTRTKVFLGNDGGLVSTADLGSTYSYLNAGVATILMTWFDIGRGSAANNVFSYGTAQDNGLFSHTPSQSGIEWIQGSDSDGSAVAADPLNGAHAVGSGNTYLTTNDGRNWSPSAQLPGGIRPIVFDPNGQNAYAASGQKFYQSKDNAGTFSVINTFAQGVTAIAQSKIDSNTIWVGLGNGTLQFTKNALFGAPPTWSSPTTQPAGIAGQGVAAAAVDPTNASQVVVVFPGFSGVNALNNPSRHVYLTSNGGAAWSDISGVPGGGLNNLPDLPLYSVVIDANTTPHTIIVSGDGGVFQTADQGLTWQRLGLGLPNAQMRMLALDSGVSPELLRVGSWGRSAFELAAPTGPVVQVNTNPNFGTVCLGSNPTTLLQLFNVGTQDLHISSIARISGSSDFSLVSGPATPVTILPGEELDFTIQFKPTAASLGTETAVFQINSDDSINSAQQVTYTGTSGVAKAGVVIANSGNFGNVCTGSFADLNLTVTNSGTCNLNISAISSSNPDFRTASVNAFPIVVQAGGSLAVPIRYQPAAFTLSGPETGTITVSTSDPTNATLGVPVSGSSPPPKIALTGGGGFGNVCAGSNAQQTIGVNNVGACDLKVTSASVNCSDFTIQNNPFPNVISHDFGLSLTTKFTPQSVGPKSCTLTINSNDPANPTVTQTLTATTPAVAIDVAPDQNFPATVVQNLGACTSQNPLPISNKGICNLTVNSVSIGGTNGSDFGLAGLPSSPIIVQPGHTVGDGSLKSVFAPTVVSRARQGTVTVNYENDPITHATTAVTRNWCGEGADTGARVLVTAGGVPLATVDQIQLHRLDSNRRGISVDNATKVPLQPAVTQTPPCASFRYHREWGGLSNPQQLTAGDYQITVSATVNGKKANKTVSFTLNTCSFNQNIVVAF